MEPFRPVVDFAVASLVARGAEEVDAETKPELVRVLVVDLETNQGTTPLGSCLERLALSVVRAYETREPALDLPGAMLLGEAVAGK